MKIALPIMGLVVAAGLGLMTAVALRPEPTVASTPQGQGLKVVVEDNRPQLAKAQAIVVTPPAAEAAPSFTPPPAPEPAPVRVAVLPAPVKIIKAVNVEPVAPVLSPEQQGFAWAQRHAINDGRLCPHDDTRFERGCYDYLFGSH